MDDSSFFVQQLGEKWNVVLQFKEGTSDVYELEAVLNEIQPLCRDSGLPSACIDTLVEVLFKLAVEDVKGKLDLEELILYNLIPNEKLTDYQIDTLLQWYMTVYYTRSVASNLFSYWLLVAIRLDVVSKEYVRMNYYHSLFRMLLRCVQNEGLAHLLKELTENYHVKSSSVQRLKKTYNNETDTKGRKQLAVLLRHYVELDISCAFTGKIKIVNPATLIMRDPELKKSLDSFISIHLTENSDVNQTDLEKSSSVLIKSFNGKLTGESVTNHNIGIAPVYRSKGKVDVSSLSRLSEILNNWDRLNPPSNPISIVGGKCGQLYTALSTAEWQSRLSEQVGVILKAFLHNRPHTSVNYSSLFASLAELQSISSQGLPVVSNFLTNYFVIWDGHCFQNEIINLIPWTHFNSFEDLKKFMENLFIVYITCDLEFKIKILGVFGELYTNLVLMCVVRIEGDMHIPFIERVPPWMKEDAVGMMEILVKYIEKFVDSGLIVHSPGSAFLISTLILYNKIFMVERKFNLNMLTVVSPSVVLMCQTSSCVTVINQLCYLLSCYWKEQKNAISNVNEMSATFHNNQLFLIHQYSIETVELLTKGLGSDRIDATMMGHLIGDDECEEFKKAIPVSDILSMLKNFATSPLIHQTAENLKIDPSYIKPEHCQTLMETFAPHCATLTELVLNADTGVISQGESMEV